jgi:hypothetical protein
MKIEVVGTGEPAIYLCPVVKVDQHSAFGVRRFLMFPTVVILLPFSSYFFKPR